MEDFKIDKLFTLTGNKKLTDWKNEPTVEDLLHDISNSTSSHNHYVGKIDDWLKLLYIESDKTKITKGRSGITPKVIRRLAEWRYGALSTPFLNERKLFNVTATNPIYLDAALQNELVLNFQFNALINKVKFINDYVRTAVNEGTVIVRVGWETEFQIKEKEIPVYQYVSAEPHQAIELMELMSAIGQETVENQLESSADSELFKSLPSDMQESIKASHEYGSPVIAIDTGKTQIVKEEVQTKNRPAVKVIPNSSLIIDPSCEGDFDNAKFLVYCFTTSYSELKSEGIYKNLDDIFKVNSENVLGENILNLDDSSFNRLNREVINHFQFKDKARKRLQAYEYWGYWDIDGTGVVQAIVATIVDNVIIRLERSPFPDNKLPFVLVSYLPVKGSVYGEPDAELIKDNQQIIQALTRSIIDIQARSANGQIARPKGFLDSINAKKFSNGEDYEYNPNGMHPAEAIYMHTASEVPQTVMALIQQQYAEAEASTGIKSFQGGIDANAYGQVTAGMSQAVTALTQREGDILFRLSKGLEEIGNKIIAMNGIWLNEEEIVAVTQNEFVPIKREDLAGDFFLNVTIKSNSEAEGKAQQLAFVTQTLGADVDWGIRKIMIAEICRLTNLENIAGMLMSYEPQPNELQMKKAELEIAELEAKIEKLKAEAEYFRNRGEFIDAQIDDVQADTDLKSLDFIQNQDGTKHLRQKEIVEAQAKAQNQGKVHQQALKGRTDLEVAKERNRGRIKTNVDKHTGRTFTNLPSPKRSFNPYNLPPSEPTEVDI